ncbi:GntR family transcriptional regulator [Telmatospirillum sp.]|uniref:GntR family transcriptional regulator n=1 Tax=Telmatospirillum sp. TaxID=2079197 RepID=UPI00284277C2|nr:GntR family transcriptional regulator [Telmatospirillum sp.]MDR3441320.1 GntR family transcriptional regulator [Telmatospirillum sp.]
MTRHVWSEGTPIYRQLMELLLARIMDGTYAEGALLPSVRQLASDYQINPLTVAKAFQELAIEELAEKRRGIGFVVKPGVRLALQNRERARFLREEWPTIKARMQRLGIDPRTLLDD